MPESVFCPKGCRIFCMISRCLIVALTLASIATLHADDVWVIREDGVGPAKIGMALSQLNTVLGEKFTKPSEKGEEGEGGDACFYAKPTKHPHVSFMIENGQLARVDVDAPGICTMEGIQVGDSESKALRVYGTGLKVEPHQYIDEGHYLTIRSRDGRYGMRFETEKGKITSFYGGRFEAVQYVEGCL
jgi:hypothetical protein